MAGIKAKRQYILKQVANVSNWIREFDPQNVNFVDLKVPKFISDNEGEVTMKQRKNKIDHIIRMSNSEDQRQQWDHSQWNDSLSLGDSMSIDSDGGFERVNQNYGRGNQSMQIIQKPILVSSSKVLMSQGRFGQSGSNLSIDSNDSGDQCIVQQRPEQTYQGYYPSYSAVRG